MSPYRFSTHQRLRAISVAIALCFAAASSAQDLPLEGLPGTNAPPPKPKKKPAEKKPDAEVHAKKKSAPEHTPVDDSGALIAAPATPAPAEAAPSQPAALPEVPLLQLSSRIAVAFVRSPLFDEATAVDVESGLRGVAFQAPLSQNPIVLRNAAGAAPCEANDDACFLVRGGKEGADSVLIAVADKGPQGYRLRERQLIIAGNKKVVQVEANAPADPLALKAAAEALACKLLVPNGCAGELALDVDPAEVLYDGRALPRAAGTPARYSLPIGLAPLSLRVNGVTGPPRMVPVLREKQPGAAMSLRLDPDGTPRLVSPSEALAPAPAAAIATAPSEHPRWIKPAGYAVAGVGGAILIAGLFEGLHAKSLQSDATTAFNANGGAWKQSDLGNLSSANSAAHTANLLMIIGGIAAAAGLACALAF